MDATSPIVGLLVGLPGLSRRLGMEMFAALDQRIATRYVIEPMDLGESSAYIAHHLALVGRTEPLIAADAVARLHRYANGLPRTQQCGVAALIAAAGENKDLVDDASAKRAVAELPNATYVELDCEDHPPWLGDTEQVRREIERFFDRAIAR